MTQHCIRHLIRRLCAFLGFALQPLICCRRDFHGMQVLEALVVAGDGASVTASPRCSTVPTSSIVASHLADLWRSALVWRGADGEHVVRTVPEVFGSSIAGLGTPMHELRPDLASGAEPRRAPGDDRRGPRRCAGDAREDDVGACARRAAHRRARAPDGPLAHRAPPPDARLGRSRRVAPRGRARAPRGRLHRRPELQPQAPGPARLARRRRRWWRGQRAAHPDRRARSACGAPSRPGCCGQAGSRCATSGSPSTSSTSRPSAPPSSSRWRMPPGSSPTTARSCPSGPHRRDRRVALDRGRAPVGDPRAGLGRLDPGAAPRRATRDRRRPGQRPRPRGAVAGDPRRAPRRAARAGDPRAGPGRRRRLAAGTARVAPPEPRRDGARRGRRSGAARGRVARRDRPGRPLRGRPSPRRLRIPPTLLALLLVLLPPAASASASPPRFEVIAEAGSLAASPRTGVAPPRVEVMAGATSVAASPRTGARAVTRMQAVAAAMSAHLPAPVDHVLVQADLTAVAPGPLVGSLGAFMRLAADIESRGGATVYRFTPESVRRALDAGWTSAEVIDTVRRSSRTPVPQPLEYLVSDVARRHGQTRIGGAAAYIRSDDAAVLDTMLASRDLSALQLRRLAPTVLVSSADPRVLVDLLREHGFAPVHESRDGTVVHTEAPRRRSGTRRRGPAPDRHAGRPRLDAQPRRVAARGGGERRRPPRRARPAGRAEHPRDRPRRHPRPAARRGGRAPRRLDRAVRPGRHHDAAPHPPRSGRGRSRLGHRRHGRQRTFSVHRITGATIEA